VPLKREEVARAALQVLDEVGLDRLTVRRLAAHLDIQNPSLYTHFTSKQELLNCMAELMIADALAELRPARQDQDWADWLAEFARLFLRMMFRYRDGARIMAEANLSLTKLFEGAELALGILQNAGFSATDAADGMITALHYVLGHAFQAEADPVLREYGKDDRSPKSLQIAIDGERLPRLAALLHTTDVLSPTSANARFEAGLSLILDGLRVKLAQERSNQQG
jgi:TetR/AcrR family tetracycline transcriptional repressor